MIALNEWLLAGSELARLSVRVWQESGRRRSYADRCWYRIELPIRTSTMPPMTVA
jgi:hypothetical protein